MRDEALLQNLKIELRRGTMVLAVISQLKEMQYGYSLLQTLVDKKVAIEAGTLYPLLRRLEAQGILNSAWDTSEARPRKYYQLSNFGKEVYEKLRNEWELINQEMNRLLREESV